jgi:hypothetical protein
MLALAATGVASGTPIPSASQIMGAAHNVWTLGPGVVHKNGNSVGYSANVSPPAARAGFASMSKCMTSSRVPSLSYSAIAGASL